MVSFSKQKLQDFQALLYGFDGKEKEGIYSDFINQLGDFADKDLIKEWDEELKKLDYMPTPKLTKKKSRFDKIYNYYDLKKEYDKGYMKGSIITVIIIFVSFGLGRLF